MINELSWSSLVIKYPQLCKFNQCCCGIIIIFQINESIAWKLGIVGSIFPTNTPPVIDLFELTGPNSSIPVLELANLKMIKEWSDFCHHYRLQEFYTESIEMLFMNQIWVIVGKGWISDFPKFVLHCEICLDMLKKSLKSAKLQGKKKRTSKHVFFLSFIVMLSSCPNKFKNAIKNEKCQSFFLQVIIWCALHTRIFQEDNGTVIFFWYI